MNNSSSTASSIPFGSRYLSTGSTFNTITVSEYGSKADETRRNPMETFFLNDDIVPPSHKPISVPSLSSKPDTSSQVSNMLVNQKKRPATNQITSHVPQQPPRSMIQPTRPVQSSSKQSLPTKSPSMDRVLPVPTVSPSSPPPTDSPLLMTESESSEPFSFHPMDTLLKTRSNQIMVPDSAPDSAPAPAPVPDSAPASAPASASASEPIVPDMEMMKRKIVDFYINCHMESINKIKHKFSCDTSCIPSDEMNAIFSTGMKDVEDRLNSTANEFKSIITPLIRDAFVSVNSQVNVFIDRSNGILEKTCNHASKKIFDDAIMQHEKIVIEKENAERAFQESLEKMKKIEQWKTNNRRNT